MSPWTSEAYLLIEDLGVNFNGHPLEMLSYIFSDRIEKYIQENELAKFPKNKRYILKLSIEEYKILYTSIFELSFHTEVEQKHEASACISK